MNDADPFADLSEHKVLSLDSLLNIRDAATYLVRVEGDSMQGAGSHSGARHQTSGSQPIQSP